MSERTQVETKPVAATLSQIQSGQTNLLQRKCDCGGSAGLSGQCAECDKQRLTLQRHSANQFAAPPIPSIVHDVLRSPGQSLDGDTRAFMESRFGHDFSRVRVHADSRASDSARAVNAIAYTVGQDVVFQAGQYQPNTEAGKRLLAHELTHVVQQSNAGSESSRNNHSSELTLGQSGDRAEREADRNAEAIGGVRAAGINFNAQTGVQAGTIQRVPATDEEVEKSLKAAERARTAPAGAPGEKTDMLMRGSSIVYRLISKFLPAYSDKISGVSYDEKLAGVKVVKSQKGDISITVGKDFILKTTEDTLQQRVAEIEAQLRGGNAPPAVCNPGRKLTWADFTGTPSGTHSAFTGFDFVLATVGTEQIIRADFAASRSFVRPQFGDPGNRAVNGCAALVTACRNVYKTNPNATVPLSPPKNCAASVSPNLSLQATNSGECDSVLGTECDRVAVLESARLLRHEQLHFDIACNLARNGTRLLAAQPAKAQDILTAVKDKAKDLSGNTGLYDTETNHGCNAAEQAAWEKYVKTGLPTVTIP